MKAGMIIGAVINLLVGVLLVALAVILPLVMGTKNIFMSIGLGFGGLVCIIVGVVLWAAGGRILGQNPLLTTGLPATAVIKAVRDTGITMQYGAYAILEFNLEVGFGMGSPYQVTCRSTVPRIALSMVGLGKIVAVRVDPQNRERVVIDWSSVPS